MDATPSSQSPFGRRRVLYVGGGVAAVAVVVGLVIALTGASGSSKSSAPNGAGTTTTSSEPAAGSTGPENGKTSTSTSSSSSTLSANHGSTAGTNVANTSPGDPPNSTGGGGSGGGGTTTPASAPVVPPATPDTTFQAEQVDTAYRATYEAECKSIWANADSDGVLIAIDDPEKHPFLLSDCTSLMDAEDGEYLIYTVDDAKAQATQDALWNLDDAMVGRRLGNTSGTKIWVSPISSDGH